MNHKELLLARQLFVLIQPPRLPTPLAEKDLLIGNPQNHTDDRHTTLKPGRMLLITHPMPPVIFRQINIVFIKLDTKRELRQIMIVYPETRNTLPLRQFTGMTPHLLQPVPEHNKFLLIHTLPPFEFAANNGTPSPPKYRNRQSPTIMS
jgi:hypothetical protein